MVKGVSKQAVIVPSPDPKKFEQAIFIVNSGSTANGIQSADEMLNIACRLASRYDLTAAPVKGRLRRFSVPLLSFLLGTGAASAVWFFLSAV